MLMFIVISLRCSSNEDTNNRISLLLRENSELNELISNKDWDEIYDMLLKTKEMNLTERILPSRASFNRQYNQGEPATYNIKYLSYISFKDTALTSNQIRTELKINYLGIDTAAVDTSYHFWKYRDGNWYLLNFELRELSDRTKNKFNQN